MWQELLPRPDVPREASPYHVFVRPPDIPTDDLYARLELPFSADPEAVEIAWRALLKRHHPDVAGAASLQLAKQINVAHDWLSDPILRARYDRARPVKSAGTASSRRTAWAPSPQRAARRPTVRRVRDADDLPPDLGLDSPPVTAFLERIGRLTNDELDRLGGADPPPIAFVASIRRFLAAERLANLAALEDAVEQRLHGRARREAPVRQAILSYGQLLMLERFLAEELSEPFRERVHERMARGWQSAVGMDRYGPYTSVVRRFLEQAARISPAEGARLVEASRTMDLAHRPWPPGVDPDEDDVQRVSAELAARDAGAVAKAGFSRAIAGDLAEVLAFSAHVLALGSAFSPTARRRLLRPWLSVVENPG